MNALVPARQIDQAMTPAPEPLIRLSGITKTYAARAGSASVTALADVSLDVPRGAIVGVIGRSGAGKSTLIRLVNGLERPTSGDVVVDGVRISALSEAQLRHQRRSIGMIFQHFNLLSSRTVFDNVALSLEIAGADSRLIKRKVDELIDLVGLGDKRNRYPAELSGGQKQRVGIARALATDPKALLSDEATSALDPETTRSILDLLRKVNSELGVTILLITHEMSVIRGVADRVAVIESGRIVEHGDVFDIFTRPMHPTTRSFLASEAGRAIPGHLATRLQPEPVPGGTAIVRIVFRGPHATDPVLSQLARELSLDVNILSGAIDEVAGRAFGTLVVGIAAPEADLARALAFLAARGLDTEVLGHVA